jgi:hypothetical protein
MGVKAEKTFEEIVERLAALVGLKPRPVERNYEESNGEDSAHERLPATKKPTRSRKNNNKE